MRIEPSLSFKKSVKKTIVSIVIFALTYVLLLCTAVGITIGFTLLGVWIFTMKPMLYTGILCIGLFASGLTVLYFLIKFVFASTKEDRRGLVEIKEEDQPNLFGLIREVVEQVDTQFPKKVFLDPHVNASVFYDSSFWSMFIPIRKNLLIGTGLINSVTQQELRAILAHEFGHFSQRSMKVGSYVYHVNHILYNMLYNNDTLNKLLDKWDNMSSYSAIFIKLSAFIIKQIQAILDKLYRYVNHHYMALSREMEFHADEIAAHVAGSKALADALLRLPFAHYALQSVLSFYEEKVIINVRPRNIYPEQHFVMELWAKKFNCAAQHGFPLITIDQLPRIYRSKLNITDQWTSHPSAEDRVKALQTLNINTPETDVKPAMLLLANNDTIGNLFANTIFDDDRYTEGSTQYSLEDFQTQFLNFVAKSELDTKFNGYYDQHTFSFKATELLSSISMDEQPRFEDLYSDQRVENLNELLTLKNDISVLQAIKAKELPVKSFDYDGHKYAAEQVDQLLEELEKDVFQREKELEQYDLQIFHYFRELAINQSRKNDFEQVYNDYVAVQTYVEENMRLHQEIIDNSVFLFQTLSYEDIEARLSDLARRESRLKRELKHLLADMVIQQELEEKIKAGLARYTNEELSYFHVDEYHAENLDLLMQAIQQFEVLSQRHLFLAKKRMLDFNLSLVENSFRQAVS